jgi:copper chaperone NosL
LNTSVVVAMNRTSIILAATASFMLLAGLVGCPHGRPQPVAIVLSEDSCAQCRMAVSVKKFAAELVTIEGHVDYFDDIGCLLTAIKAHGQPVGAVAFVVDFNTGQWLDAAQALYVQAKGMPTPMSSGLAAFGTRDAAQVQAKSWSGQVLDWETLCKEFTP